LTDRGPDVRARINPDAAMAPNIWAMQNNTNRRGSISPTRRRARVMFGLNGPPVTRKKSHAETRRLRPMDVEIYRTCSIANPPESVVESPFATWMPPRPSKRKTVVPTNSTMAASASTLKLEKYDVNDMQTMLDGTS